MILERFQEKFSSHIVSHTQAFGNLVVTVKKDQIHEMLAFLKSDPALDFNLFMDACGIDYQGMPELPADFPRFAVLYNLYSLQHQHRIQLKVQIPYQDGVEMVLPTAMGVWAGANWYEREIWDMFGIRFDGHPHLKRLLLYDAFEGHPLRKDYPMAKRQKIPLQENNP